MINRRNWTVDELDYLKENYGRYTMKNICKELDRTPSSIQNKVSRLNLGRWYWNADYASLSDVAKACGMSYGTLKHWAEVHHFPIIKRRLKKDFFQFVDIEEFWKWAETHKNMVRWDKFERGSMGAEPDWVQEARKGKFLERNRSAKKAAWTKDEDEKLIWLLKQYKYTYSDISKELGRTHGAVKRRLRDLEIRLRPVYRDNHKKYTEEEIRYILEKYQAGYGFKTIAEELNRSEEGVRGKVERLGYRFKNRVLVK